MRKILFLCCMLGTASAVHAQTKNFIDQPYIEVSGDADSLVTPDEIYIQINVSEKDTRNKVSLETLENQMAEALKSLGIDIGKDLVVNDIASNFKVYLLKGKDVLKSKQYILKVNDAETAAKVFVKLEDLGISNASIDHTNISQKEAIGRTLLSKAVEDARDNAIALTAPLHQKIGNAVHITSNRTAGMNALQGRVSGVVVASGYKKSAGLPEPVPDISFEKIRMTANVSVKFILQ